MLVDNDTLVWFFILLNNDIVNQSLCFYINVLLVSQLEQVIFVVMDEVIFSEQFNVFFIGIVVVLEVGVMLILQVVSLSGGCMLCFIGVGIVEE